MKAKGLWLGLLVMLLLLPAGAVHADGYIADADGYIADADGYIADAGEYGVSFDNGQIFVEEDVALGRGETINGDVGIFEGDLEMAAGSTINGDLFIADGDAQIAGRVNGDVAVIEGDLELTASGQVNGDVFGMSGSQEIAGRVNGNLSVLFGEVELGNTAVVEGDVLAAPGTVERAAGAQVRGEMVQDIPVPPLPFLEGWSEEMPRLTAPPIPDLPDLPAVPEPPAPPELPRTEFRARPQPTLLQQMGNFVGRVLGAMFMSLLAIAAGMLIVFIWPRTTRRVSRCISAMPVQSLGLGLLTFLIAAAVEVLAVMVMVVVILIGTLMIGTVILIPIGLLLILLSVVLLLPVPLALAGGMVLGWVAMAEMIGRRVFVALRIEDPTPLSAALVGLVITVPLAALLWLVMPLCCGWPFVIVLTSLGLGAVFHTRFGTQDCQTSKVPVLPAEAMEEEAGRPDGP